MYNAIPASVPTWIDVQARVGLDNVGALAYDVEAVRNSVKNILMTPIGTRPYEREYGSWLHHYLQEPLTLTTVESCRTSLIESIKRWEPRIQIDTSKTVMELLRQDPGFRLTLFYKIIVPETTDQLVLDIRRI